MFMDGAIGITELKPDDGWLKTAVSLVLISSDKCTVSLGHVDGAVEYNSWHKFHVTQVMRR